MKKIVLEDFLPKEKKDEQRGGGTGKKSETKPEKSSGSNARSGKKSSDGSKGANKKQADTTSTLDGSSNVSDDAMVKDRTDGIAGESS